MAAASEYTYKYPRPGLTVDTCIIGQDQAQQEPKVLLIQRKFEPFTGSWVLPGGFVDQDEPLLAAAQRELQEETSVDPASVPFQQVGAYGDPGRDPRGWTVTVAYVAVVPTTDLGVQAADDAANAQWWNVTEIPKLAFDHKLVVRDSLLCASAMEIASDKGMVDFLTKGAELLAGDWQQ